ncbi:MAG TPA: nitrilase-related carbon-nitrogen hydrolase [Sulfuricurvum sp.]|nr:nitrilase-related carbon-nitrogen hydrolase [Sulfuricurvum sp.]
MKVALIQSAPKLNRTNLQAVLHILETHQDADVVVFPELALSGYMLQDKLFEDAWNLDELDGLKTASQKCDIAIGAAVWDNGKVYNSALYFSQGELVHMHHKNHLPNYGMFEEGRYFAAGNSISGFKTRYGNAAMVICEDVWRADTMAALAVCDPDVIYVLAASPARDFTEEGLVIERQWDALIKSLALLTHAYVVLVNRVGFEDGLGFWGGSRVITPAGQTEHQLALLDPEERVVPLNHALQKLERYLAKHA